MRTFPNIYGQRDYNDELGTVSGSTIANEGCFLTSFAMIAGYFGHQVTPPQLNQIFINDKIFVSGNLCPDNGLHQAYADCQFTQTLNFANVPADLDAIAALSADPTNAMVVEVDFDHNPNNGIQTHFMALKDCTKQADGSFLIYVYDPWYKSCDQFSLHYGTDPKTTILKIVVYKGTPMTVSAPTNMYTMQSGNQVDLSNVASNKVLADKFDEVMYQGIYIKKADADAACTARTSAMQQQIDGLANVISTYKTNQNQLLDILGLKTTDGQPEIVGAINGVKKQEDAFKAANETVLKLQEQVRQDAIDKQTAVNDLDKQISVLENKQQTDLQNLATQQAIEITNVKNQCVVLKNSITQTVNKQETVSFFQRFLNLLSGITIKK